MNLFQRIIDSITKAEDFWNWCDIALKDEKSQVCNPIKKEPATPSIQGNANPKEAKDQSTCSPTLTQANPSRSTEQKTDRRNRNPLEKWRNHANEWKPLYECFGFGAAIFIAICTVWQIRNSTQARNLDERAWVLATGSFVVADAGMNGDKKISITFKNTGKTPAINVQSVVFSTKRQKLIPEKEGRPSASSGGMLCAPEQTTDFNTSFPSSIMDEIVEGVPFYVYGTIWYNDIFGGNHWSQFAFRIVQIPNTDVLRSAPLAFHNSCDDDADYANNGKKPTNIPDEIEDTRFTTAEIESDFPLGYIIFRLQNAKCTYEPHQPPQDPSLKITADWSKVKIAPNFSDRTVEWQIPEFGFSKQSTRESDGNFIDQTFLMDAGKAFPANIAVIKDQPEMFLGTLGDNPLHPVFVIGFKIRQNAPSPEK